MPDPLPSFVVELMNKQKVVLKAMLVCKLFFYTSLTSIKLSFLFFFRRLGHNINRLNYLWWSNLIFTLMVWLICLGNTQYHCLIGPPDKINGVCNQKAATDYARTTLQANCGLDVASDLASTSIDHPTLTIFCLM